MGSPADPPPAAKLLGKGFLVAAVFLGAVAALAAVRATSTPPPVVAVGAPNADGTYTVEWGDCWYCIAARLRLDPGALTAANNMTLATALHPGMILRVPGTSPAPAPGPAPAPAPSGTAYTVRAGDCWSCIASRLGIPMGSLLAANEASTSTMLHPGMVIKLPAGTSAPTPAPAPAPAPGPAPAPSGTTYTVRAGDCWSCIASRLGISMGSLLAANGASTSTMLHPGMVIKLPAGTSAPTPAPAPSRVIETRRLGTSVEGRGITAYRLGTPGGKVVLVVGSIHGDEEAGIEVTDHLLTSASIPSGIDLWVVPTITPDGNVRNTRVNARGVDLNRNFATNWQPVDCSVYPTRCSGPSAASEPETRAAQDFIRAIQPRMTIWYHGADYAVDAGNNAVVTQAYATAAGYRISSIPCSPACTGTASQFTNANVAGSSAFTVELSTKLAGGLSPTGVANHVRAVFAAAAVA